MRKMRGFNNRCIRSMLGVTKNRQWKERITSKAIGMTESMAEILRRYRLRWLGHVARMEDYRMPKQLLFGELTRPRPSHGTKRRWGDLAAGDVQATGLGETSYEVAQNRREWTTIYKQCLADDTQNSHRGPLAPTSTECTYVCSSGRSFKRQGTLTRHSRFCDGHGKRASSTYDYSCGRSFRWQGDLTRHSRFCNETQQSHRQEVSIYECLCGRTFRR